MPNSDSGVGAVDNHGGPDGISEFRRQKILLKPGVLHDAIFNSACFSTIATDGKGVIQIFNVGAERMLGYAALDVVDKIALADICDPQDLIARATALSLELATPIAADFEALVSKASRGIEDHFELTCIRKDGSRFPVSVTTTALRDDDASIIGYLLIGAAVADRKRTAELPRESQARLHHAAKAARLTYVEVDLAGGGARTAGNFAEIMGYAPPPGEQADVSVGARLLLEHVVPHDRLRVERALQDFVAGKSVGRIDYRVLGDDRIERWIESAWSIEYDPDGKPLKTFATNLDITEHRSAAKNLRETEERLRVALEAAELGIWNLDTTTGLFTSDVRFRAIFGVSVEGLNEEQALANIHPGDRDRIQDAVTAATRLDDPVPYEVEYRVMYADESIHWVLAKGRANFGDEGCGRKLLSFAGTVADITGRKQAEAALRESEDFNRSIIESSPDCIRASIWKGIYYRC